jgi:hypothetical protein
MRQRLHILHTFLEAIKQKVQKVQYEVLYQESRCPQLAQVKSNTYRDEKLCK